MYQSPPKIETPAAGLPASSKNPVRRKSSFRWAFSAAVLLSFVGAGGALAADETAWQYGGATAGPWATPGNWSFGLPTSTSTAIFGPSSGSGTTTLAFDSTTTFYDVGAVVMATDATAARTIQNTSGVGELRVYGVDTMIGGESVKLLLGDFSSTLGLSILGSASTATLFTLYLYSSGVFHTDGGQISEGAIIADGGGEARSVTKTGTGALRFTFNGAGTLSNSSYSTYSGGFTLKEGSVEWVTAVALVDGVLTKSPFGTGTLTLEGGIVRTGAAAALSIYNDVALNGSVTFGSTVSGKTGALTVAADGGGTTVLTGDSTINTVKPTTWAQDISGDHSLTKAGTDNLVIQGTDTHTGATTVAAGGLWVTGALTSSPVTVLSGAIFGGTGTVTSNIAVNSGGIFAPGGQTNPGTLMTTGDITLSAGAALSFDLFDLLSASGSVNLGGADLQYSLLYQPTEGEVFVLIDTMGVGTISGALSYGGSILDDGALFTVTSGEYSQEFQIDYDWTSPDSTYTGALALIAVPEPSAAMLLLAGVAGVAGWRRRSEGRAPARP